MQDAHKGKEKEKEKEKINIIVKEKHATFSSYFLF
jgi:hypothetical protein